MLLKQILLFFIFQNIFADVVAEAVVVLFSIQT